MSVIVKLEILYGNDEKTKNLVFLLRKEDSIMAKIKILNSNK